jgi:hypothetical protein
MGTGSRSRYPFDVALRVVPLIVSLAALALSVVALRRSESPKPAGSVREAAEPGVAAAAPRSFALQAWPRSSIPPPTDVGPAPRPTAVVLPRTGLTPQGGKPPSASVAATAAKLRVRADALARLADASGNLPAAFEARLFHAQSAGAEVAARVKLDERQRDVVADVLVDYVIRTVRDASGGDPDAPPDPDRLAEVKQDALAAIRGAAGPDAEPEVARMIDGL